MIQIYEKLNIVYLLIKGTNMFPLHSVLRYYPSNDIHYTAKILEEGVFQIKGGPRCMYSSVEEWLSTLPGFSDPSNLKSMYW